MNLILLYQEDFISDTCVRLTGRRAEHVLSVHRAECGKQLTVGLINNKIGTGLVTKRETNLVELEVQLESVAPAPIPVTLILALPRPKSLKKALHAAMTMGVKNIHIINSYKVDKSYWQTPVLQEKGLNEQISLALEQCKDTQLPNIFLHKRFKPFVEDELHEIVQGTRAMVAHPIASEKCPFEVKEPVTLVIGPEGGFTDYEIDLLEKNGTQAVSIGPHILRVEYAIPAILGKLF